MVGGTGGSPSHKGTAALGKEHWTFWVPLVGEKWDPVKGIVERTSSV